MRRSWDTLGVYATIGCLGYLLTGLGTIQPELRTEFGLSRFEVGLYPSAFALGLVVVGIAGHHLARVLGSWALPVALTALVGGAVVLALGAIPLVSGVGALIFGFGGAALVQLVPARLRAEHGAGATVAIGEANALGSTASVLAPLLIGAALATGLGWRTGYLVVPVLALAVLLAGPLRPARIPEAVEVASAGRAPRAFLGWWVDLVLSVGIEFSVLFFAVDYLHTDGGFSSGAATFGAAAFVLGMAAGRISVGPATRLVPAPARLLALAAGLATVGFGFFWSAMNHIVMIAGLVATGLGVALLYPVALGQALAVWPSQPDRAAARGALASGVAAGCAPVLLGALADTGGLRSAFLLAPVLSLTLLVHCALRLRRPVPALVTEV